MWQTSWRTMGRDVGQAVVQVWVAETGHGFVRKLGHVVETISERRHDFLVNQPAHPTVRLPIGKQRLDGFELAQVFAGHRGVGAV